MNMPKRSWTNHRVSPAVGAGCSVIGLSSRCALRADAARFEAAAPRLIVTGRRGMSSKKRILNASGTDSRQIPLSLIGEKESDTALRGKKESATLKGPDSPDAVFGSCTLKDQERSL